MKKVLIIAYYFPPNPNVGSQRPYRLAKYFPKYGWGPIILTPAIPRKLSEELRIIETDYKDIRVSFKSKIGFSPNKGLQEQLGITVNKKNYGHSTWKSKIIKLFLEITNFPDTRRGWYKFALKAASELICNERIDAIISTSSPATSHLIGRKLKLKYSIPWIADLRDLWTNNHFYKKYELIRYFERRLELKTLSDADALVTVTHKFADELKILHKDKRIISITNGFDNDDFDDVQINLTNKFTITHTGKLYNGKRDPLLLFEVITQLINEKKLNKDLVEIRFYGFCENWLMQDIKRFNLEKITSVHDLIPREEAIKKQRESQLLLLLVDKNNKEQNVYPFKMFEYLGARRPIICIGGNGGIVKELLENINAGVFASNANILRNILLEYYNEFLKHSNIRCCGNSDIDNYTFSSITKEYSEILNGLV